MPDDPTVRLTIRYPARIPVDDEIELSLVEDEDAREIFALTDRNREYLRRWLPWVDGTRSIADTRAFVERSHEQVRRGEGFQACIRHRGQTVGVIGFVYVNAANRRAEIGYWLAETFQGQGIMTRACRGLLEFAFSSLELNRIEIRADVDNRRSRAIPERLGFVQEAVLRESAAVNGRYVDVAMYALLRDAWTARPSRGPAKPLQGPPAVPPAKE